MNEFVVHELAANVRVRVTRPMPPLPTILERQIDRLWNKAAERVAGGGAGRLFNGRVFCADVITPTEITGHLTEYRRLVAQCEDHALFEALGIRSLAVCGILRCAGGVVVGRRPPAAIYQPDMWQLSPAGSVDAGALCPDNTMDLRRQLLTELREEVGLPAGSVNGARPLCLVEHGGSHVSDLGMMLTTKLDATAVLAAHARSGNREYDPLMIVPDAELGAFVDAAGPTLVPPAREFLVRAGLLPPRYAIGATRA
jgi:hypothetical protein